MPTKVCIQPCLGMNTAETTVGRQASYLAHEVLLGTEKSDLGCSPALYANVQEDVDFILEDYVIVVESCEEGCAGKLVSERGGEAHAVVRVDQVLASHGINANELPVDHLDLDHPAVRAVGEEIAKVAEQLLSPSDAE